MFYSVIRVRVYSSVTHSHQETSSVALGKGWWRWSLIGDRGRNRVCDSYSICCHPYRWYALHALPWGGSLSNYSAFLTMTWKGNLRTTKYNDTLLYQGYKERLARYVLHSFQVHRTAMKNVLRSCQVHQTAMENVTPASIYWS